MQVVDVHPILDGPQAQLVRGAADEYHKHNPYNCLHRIIPGRTTLQKQTNLIDLLI